MLRHTRELLLGAAAGVVVLCIGALFIFQYDLFRNASSSSSSTVKGSGIAASETRKVAAFTSVELAGSNAVDISVDGTRSVVVHADDNLLSHVTTTVTGGRLVIGEIPGSFQTKAEMRVDIHVPTLDALTLTGSGVVSATGIEAESFTVKLDGSGVIHAAGTVQRLDVSLGGSGDAQLGELSARSVHAVVGGSGRIVTTATDTLDAAVPGSGAVVYGGAPTHVTSNVTGSGAVIPG
jgi:Putative auto-transporter adhesin, head GIN domain